ncbi:MAG: hypothetical protein H6620_04930 [Halobacteriovoraceae bacterium]|nr:hypothetical protein [Halobacteriovoraceae bacterium]
MFILTLFMFSWNVFGSGKNEVVYFNKMFGHVHNKPYELSSSETTIACGYPLRILENKDNNFKEWSYVELGEKKGFISNQYLSKNRPQCFQKNYNEFYNELSLDLGELYYWGRLYDQYIQVETKP